MDAIIGLTIGILLILLALVGFAAGAMASAFGAGILSVLPVGCLIAGVVFIFTANASSKRNHAAVPKIASEPTPLNKPLFAVIVVITLIGMGALYWLFTKDNPAF